MPKAIEAEFRRGAAKKGLTGDRADAYVYGGMNNAGYMHGSKITTKGRGSERKHVASHAAAKIRRK